jgi:uncharacterized protein YndB with AHSA1/START domain
MSAMTSKPFILERTIDAPRDVVWRAWIDAGPLAGWFGPKGMACTVHRLDLRPGGVFHYSLEDAEHGIEMWGKWTYREIVAPEKLVVEISFSDRDLGLTRHPFAPEWPLRTLSTTTFSEDGDRTVVITRWETVDATPAEQDMFDNGHDGMNQGWGGMMDQFAEFLAR